MVWVTQLVVDDSVCGGLVQIWLTLAVLRLSVLANSTGLVSGAYRFLGVFHMLLISLYFFSLACCFLVTVSPSACMQVPVEHVHMNSQQRDFDDICPLLFNMRRGAQPLDSSVHVTFKEMSSVVCNWPVSWLHCHLLSIIGCTSF